MADSKISELSANTDPQPSDIVPMVDDPGGTPTTEKITLQNLLEVVDGFDANTDPQATDELLILDDPGGTLLGEKITIANLLLATSDIIPAARVYNNATESIPNATWTGLTFNSEYYDTDTIHDTSTNSDRLTCKTAGKYAVFFTGSFAANGTGNRICAFEKNGVATSSGSFLAVREFEPYLALNSCRMQLYTEINLAINDYVTVSVYQNSTGSLNIESGNYSPLVFGMVRIGD